MNALGTALLTSLLLVLLTGCSWHGTDEPAAGPPAGPPAEAGSAASIGTTPAEMETPLAPVWTSDLEAVGQPVLAGTTAVVVTRARRDELDIVGLDAATGGAAVALPYSPGDVATGYGIAPQVLTSRTGVESVVFQRPARGLSAASGWSAPLLVVDPADGRVRSSTSAVDVDEPLSPCVDGVDACALMESASGVGARRLDLDTGRLETEQDGAPPGARSLGPGGLFGTVDRPDERIGVARGGRERWQLPAAALFGDGYVSDNGWSFAYDERAHRFVGLLGRDLSQEREAFAAGRRVELDLADQQLVSFSARDGDIVWADRGLTPCGLDPQGDLSREDGSVVAVRCRVAGTSINQQGSPVRYRDLAAAVEGYDPETGDTTWSQPLARPAAVSAVTGEAPITGRDTASLVLRTPEGTVLLDTADGSTVPVTPQSRFLCDRDLTISYAVPWHGLDQRTAGTLRRSCDARGKAVPGAPSTTAVIDGGVPAGDGRYLVATRDGVSAYDVGLG